jgi:folate-dependent phosphoribosylglycinamide formyltransferase PurN
LFERPDDGILKPLWRASKAAFFVFFGQIRGLLMRLVYMGSPSEVIAPLESLIKHCQKSGDEVVAVVSQPAKPAGRKQTLTDPPVATFAKEQGLRCLQPIKASDPAFLEELKSLEVDVIITAAYGQILSNAFLAIPRRATINIHPSLLPAYRGAIPVPAALLDGLETTGVTVLFTVKALDAGNIILQKSFAIEGFLPRAVHSSSKPWINCGTKILSATFKMKVALRSAAKLLRLMALSTGIKTQRRFSMNFGLINLGQEATVNARRCACLSKK